MEKWVALYKILLLDAIFPEEMNFFPTLLQQKCEQSKKIHLGMTFFKKSLFNRHSEAFLKHFGQEIFVFFWSLKGLKC